jgi:hypothetical protein
MASSSRDADKDIISDAEVVLGLSRHLAAYATTPAKAALAQLEFAGHAFEMAWRLRKSGLSSVSRVAAIGIEAGIGARQLVRDVLPALESLGWLELRRDSVGAVIAVDERIPPAPELVAASGAILGIALPTEDEKAALDVLRATIRQPLTKSAAFELCTIEHSEAAVEEALRHLQSVNLVRRVTTDDGTDVIFNPNIWVDEPEVVNAALRVEDARVRKEVGALIEEVADYPGLPQEQVAATEPRWIDFAVALGLVQRSIVVGDEGVERAFLFTPHLTRDPFGLSRGDPSGHVRQLVGSMIYATTYSRFRLDNPAAFVRRLIRDGEAGDASPIETDYSMLETAGIVRVEPAIRYHKFVLLQDDVAEAALRHLADSGPAAGRTSSDLRAQRSYVHLERERARLAHDVPLNDVESERLISALRDATARRGFHGG